MTSESVYPNVNHGIRPLLHRVINPFHPSGSNPGIGILWSGNGNVDNRRGFSYEPNHFVLLLSEHSTRKRLFPSCNTSTTERKWAHKIRSLQEPQTRNIPCLNV